MTRYIFLILFIFALGFTANAQTSYSVKLNWTASTSSTTTPGTVSVFRAVGNCPTTGIGSLTYSTLSTTAPAAGPFTDSTVAYATTYCYFVEEVISGKSSGPSNTFQAAIPSAIAPPSSLGGTVTQVVVTVTSN